MAADVTMADLVALSSESSFSGAPTDASSNVASFTSTPPTTVSPDSMSLASDPDVPKQDGAIAPLLNIAIPLLDSEQQESGLQTPIGNAIVVAEPTPTPEPQPGRGRRSRTSLPIYNLTKLSSARTASKRRARDDEAADARRRSTGDSLGGAADASISEGGLNGLRTPRSARTAGAAASPAGAQITRRATRLSGIEAETLAKKLATLPKRGKKVFEKNMPRELRRLQDTNEFAHIETQPVRYTVWSNGKYVDPEELKNQPEPRPKKKNKLEEDVDEDAHKKEGSRSESESKDHGEKKPRTKKWLDKGLYAGQEAPTDLTRGLTNQEKRKLATLPELSKSHKPNRTLPFPMFNGLRLLITGRDFKLPFDVCNPLPPGQPKPAHYRSMTRNRFVGDAAAYWKKTPHFEDFASKCVCKPEDGCGEDCQNRIMLYECDETNCNVGKEFCQNRAFQSLQERTKKGGRYRVGVEVFKTGDRGYGVRSNRCFEANQIIMEYTGEIITIEECDRRMNEEYKDNECYYLMSFDQNMIIDATTGSIARFVNHSCSPNCRMIKWIVSGQPRMALFAGDRPIMTGEELTYDYNFDPFSAKNVQKCLCGSPNCRGVLGPKPKEVKPPKQAKEEAARKGSSKRKSKDLTGDWEDEEPATKKKRKTQAASGKKVKSVSVAKSKSKVVKVPSKAGKGKARIIKKANKVAAAVIKKGAASVSIKTKAGMVKRIGSGAAVSKGQQQRKTVKIKTTTSRKTSASSTASSSMTTIVAKTTAKKTASSQVEMTTTTTPKSRTMTPASAAKAGSARTRTPSWKVVESAEGSPAAGGRLTASPGSAAARSRKVEKEGGRSSSSSLKKRLAEASVYDFP
ncbi:histone-lysine N-methyltransferase ash1 [Echria macrotheca]|uniref:Histone-lysine N-methyltransferase ash1 n=1 Tax=Echria macrotheca TaxID=438768 RepID=A0AAJ0F7V1_9PEZI|nr:histone-lysine N-methyltransferase ash1 [Echria macrotheca]